MTDINSVPHENEHFLSDQLSRWFVYLVALSFLSLQFFLQIASTVMVKTLMRDFNVGKVGVSSLSAMLFYGYIFFLIPAGLMLDSFNSKKSILFACLALGVGCFIFGYSHTLTEAIIGRLIMGVGSCFAFINLLYIINSSFSPKNFSLMASIGETFSILFAAACTLFLPYGISLFGWRFFIVLSGWISVALFIITFLLLKNNVHEINKYTARTEVVIKSFLILLKNKQLWMLSIYGLCVFSLITVFSSLWGVPFIINVYHYNIKSAATAVMMVPLGTGTGCLFIGFVSSNIMKNKHIMIIASIACTALMSLVIYMPGISYRLLLGLLFFSGFFASTYIQSYAIAQKNYSKTGYGSAMSIITIVIMGGASLLQILLGELLHTNFLNIARNDLENFRLSFLIIPLCLFLAFVMASRIDSE